MTQQRIKNKPEVLDTLPLIGSSRWNKIKRFSPVSREKFRQLSKEGRAPKAEQMGIRCTFYSNPELHKWLSDPINYRAPGYSVSSEA